MMATKIAKVEDMRVTIAKDVIDRINSGVLRATEGTYLELNDAVIEKVDADEEREHNEGRTSLQGEALKGCSACAMGAMLIAEIDKNNHFYSGDASCVSQARVHDRLRDVFEMTQLNDIESCFEGSSFGSPSFEDYGIYHNRYPGPRTRLRAIMENIVRNEGRFVPQQDLAPEDDSPENPPTDIINLKKMKRSLGETALSALLGMEEGYTQVISNDVILSKAQWRTFWKDVIVYQNMKDEEKALEKRNNLVDKQLKKALAAQAAEEEKQRREMKRKASLAERSKPVAKKAVAKKVVPAKPKKKKAKRSR